MRVILAYLGSAAGAAALAWLRESRGAEVVTVTVDLGQGRELEAVRDRALALGAVRAHVLDLRERFVQDFVVPALRADAVHDGAVPPALALSQAILANALADIARIERTTHVAHTGGTQMHASRLDRLLADLSPSLQVIAVQRETDLTRANDRDPAAVVRDDAHVNVWGRTMPQRERSGDPGATRKGQEGDSSAAAMVEVSFAGGVPAALNGVSMPLTELIASLGTLGATHGVGRVSNAALVCDAPAAVVLQAAHRDLTLAAVPADVAHFSATVTAAYVNLIESGRWFSPLRDTLDACVEQVQRAVTGTVRVRLSQGLVSTLSTTPAPATARPRAGRVVS
ncbi:MAG: argininosuccinate synthase [Vicinamibacterales bacterium]|mgnify:CR=1 FL=1